MPQIADLDPPKPLRRVFSWEPVSPKKLKKRKIFVDRTTFKVLGFYQIEVFVEAMARNYLALIILITVPSHRRCTLAAL